MYLILVISIIVSLGFWFIIVIIIPLSIEVIIAKVTIIIIPINRVITGGVYTQLRMAGRGWSTVVEISDSALMVSDVAAVVRLAVVLKGHLNIVCSYQEQAARTWVPAVVHVPSWTSV